MKMVREFLAAALMLVAIQFLDWARKADDETVMSVLIRSWMEYEHDEEIRKLFMQKAERR